MGVALSGPALVRLCYLSFRQLFSQLTSMRKGKIRHGP